MMDFGLRLLLIPVLLMGSYSAGAAQPHDLEQAGIKAVSAERFAELRTAATQQPPLFGKEAENVSGLYVWVSHDELGAPSTMFNPGDTLFVNASFVSGGGSTVAYSGAFAIYPPAGLRGGIAISSGIFAPGTPVVSYAAWKIPKNPGCILDVAVVLARDAGGESFAVSTPFLECP
ncbi:MAG: hypothetical protein LJE84_04265 [Gammaproteobacteria bacterium]|nr:hypothetical protein [Gammaproteobacteria bacterium]